MAFYTNEPCMCALACYLTDQVGAQVNVFPEDCYAPDFEMELPPWARKFVKAFDSQRGIVTGQRALALL